MPIIRDLDVKFEEVDRCPFCNTAESTFIYNNHDRLYGNPGVFGIVKCTSCELVRVNPRPKPENIGEYYPEDKYYSYQTTGASINSISNRYFLNEFRSRIRRIVFDGMNYPGMRLNAVEKVLKPIVRRLFFRHATYGYLDKFPNYKCEGRALDVGCGNGIFLSYLKYYGWNVLGVDPSRRASEVAKKEYGINVVVGGIDSPELIPESFDFINLSHVVEHTHDPIATLLRVNELLKPDGIAYVEVPNFDSFSRKYSGKFWYPWETPRHLFMFSPDSLALLCKKSGFKIEKLTSQLGDFWAWDCTYKKEETLGRFMEMRPSVAAKEKPQLAALRIFARLHHIIKPLSGEFICCWLSK